MNEVVRKIKDSILGCGMYFMQMMRSCQRLGSLKVKVITVNTPIRDWNGILQRKDQQALRVIINFATYTVYAFVSLIKLNTIPYML